MRFEDPSVRAELVTEMDRAAALMRAASAGMLRAVARYDRRRLWQADGVTSMTAWLAARYALGWGNAREWVRVAHALERLPRIAWAYAKATSPGTSSDPWPGSPLRKPMSGGPRRLRTFVPRRCGARPGVTSGAAVREAEDARRHRYLSLCWDHERSVPWVEGMIPAEEGAALESALDQRAEQVPGDPAAADPGGARLADALLDLARGTSPHPATVVVHAGAEALLRREADQGPWLAETEGGQRLCSEAVRRLACDGRIEWVLESVGRPVGIGRRGRTIPRPLGRVLRHRDRTCRPQAASTGDGSTPTSWSTGRTAGPRTSTTWCCCATPTTA